MYTVLVKTFQKRIPCFHKRDIIKNSEQKIRINLSQNWCVACIIMLNSPKNSIIYLISWWLSFKSISKCLKSTYWLFDNAHRVTTHLKLLCQVWNLWDRSNMLLFMFATWSTKKTSPLFFSFFFLILASSGGSNSQGPN